MFGFNLHILAFSFSGRQLIKREISIYFDFKYGINAKKNQIKFIIFSKIFNIPASSLDPFTCTFSLHIRPRREISRIKFEIFLCTIFSVLACSFNNNGAECVLGLC